MIGQLRGQARLVVQPLEVVPVHVEADQLARGTVRGLAPQRLLADERRLVERRPAGPSPISNGEYFCEGMTALRAPT